MTVGRFVIAPREPGIIIIEGALGWDPDAAPDYNPLGQPGVPMQAVPLTLAQTYGGQRDATVYRDDAAPDRQVMRESDALDCGWAWPPPPTVPWVVVDPATMRIVAGPVDWDGEGACPLPIADGQQPMTEQDAQAQGYQ